MEHDAYRDPAPDAQQEYPARALMFPRVLRQYTELQTRYQAEFLEADPDASSTNVSYVMFNAEQVHSLELPGFGSDSCCLEYISTESVFSGDTNPEKSADYICLRGYFYANNQEYTREGDDASEPIPNHYDIYIAREAPPVLVQVGRIGFHTPEAWQAAPKYELTDEECTAVYTLLAQPNLSLDTEHEFCEYDEERETYE